MRLTVAVKTLKGTCNIKYIREKNKERQSERLYVSKITYDSIIDTNNQSITAFRPIYALEREENTSTRVSHQTCASCAFVRLLWKS